MHDNDTPKDVATPSRAAVLRSQKGHLRRYYPDADTSEVDRQLAEERIARKIRQVVAEAPPLTDRQKARLRALLDGGAADAT